MQFIQGNWVDLVIIAVILFFLSEAWRSGFFLILADFLGFLFSLLVALRFYGFAAEILRSNFSLSHSVSNALGFLMTAVLAEGMFGIAFTYAIKKIPAKYWKNKWSKFLAIFPAVGEALVLVAFVLTLIIGLPIAPNLKQDVTNSKIGGYIVQKTSGIEARMADIFGSVLEDSLTYLTIKPGSEETIPINVGEQRLSVDEETEAAMLELVNKERRERGIAELKLREEAVPVARDHARDMWERSYFGHVSPDGDDVGDRLIEAGVDFRLAGENLAMAPTLATAHNGLMNSQGHRENILETEFRRVGIGVIDNGVYGKMFVQVFTD